jgi:hypothetical protein
VVPGTLGTRQSDAVPLAADGTRHRVQGSDPTHLVLAQFYDFRRRSASRVVNDLQT